MRHLAGVLAGLALAGFWGSAVWAQDAAFPPQQFSPDQLDQMVAPIALYPDPLVAEITAASTFPDQIVMADRDIGQGMTVDDIGQQGFDPSVQALAHYPTLLKWLDDNLQWTTQLGRAFSTQQGDVMDAVQRMRAKAQSLGNLPNTPQETVSDDDGDIEIEPTDPNEIYLPEYNPDAIFDAPGIFCSFGLGLPIGIWWTYDWDWHNHHTIVWDGSHPRPHDWWTRPPIQRHNFPTGHVWTPGPGRVVGFGGDRGYAPPVKPTRTAPRVQPFHGSPGVVVIGAPKQQPPPRQIVTPREPAPAVEHVIPSETGARSRGTDEGIFGGGGSPRNTESYSSRGAESRGVSTPVSGGSHGGGGGGGGGGGASHGGGGGGGRGH